MSGKLSGWMAVGLAVLIAGTQLFAVKLLKQRLLWPLHITIKTLRTLHAGRVGDQVAWLAAGLAMLTVGIVAIHLR